MPWVKEKVVGTINSTNKVFTITHVPIYESLIVIFSGVMLEPVGSQPGLLEYAYSINTMTITMSLAPLNEGQRPWVRYFY